MTTACAERTGIPTALRQKLPESLRWVPASSSGLTAPTLHGLTSGIPALKHWSRRLHLRDFRSRNRHTGISPESADSLLIHGSKPDTFGLCAAAVRPTICRRSTGLCSRVVAWTHPSPDREWHGLGRTFVSPACRAARDCPSRTATCSLPANPQYIRARGFGWSWYWSYAGNPFWHSLWRCVSFELWFLLF